MIRIQCFTFNPFEENTYVLSDETNEAVIIDPGCYEKEEKDILSGYILKNSLKVKIVLNTHCHIDHVLGNEFVVDQYKVPLMIHPLEAPVLRAVKSYATNYGFPRYRETVENGNLAEGDTVKFGNSSLSVLFLPGHSPGHVAFYHTQEKFIIGGDVLFHRSIGRTDLPGGNFDTLISSIQKKLFILPDDVIVHPGHGPSTLLGDEKNLNPFCALTLG